MDATAIEQSKRFATYKMTLKKSKNYKKAEVVL